MKLFSVISLFFICSALNADTIFLENGLQIKGHVVLFTKEYVIVEIQRPEDKAYINQSFNLVEVKLIVNDWGEYIYKDKRRIPGSGFYYTADNGNGQTFSNRFLKYPNLSVFVGVAKISTELSKLREILIQEIDASLNIGQAEIKHINDQYTAIQAGLLWQYNPYLGAGLIAYWPRFGNQTSHDDDKQYFRMALAEIRLSYPLKLVTPWIGLGYASQSIKIIDRINDVDIKWSSHNMGFVLAGGSDFCFSDFFKLYIAYRDLFFSKKAAARTTTQKIDLSNQIIVGGIKLTF